MDLIKKITILIGIATLALMSCDEDVSDEDCSTYSYLDCNTLEPDEADLILRFTISNNMSSIPFEIIEGTIESGTTIIYDTAKTSEIIYIMPLNQYYTVKATYKNEVKTIFALDGVNMKARSTQKCDSVCWTLPKFELNLTLQ